jgi:hypothetical protein
MMNSQEVRPLADYSIPGNGNHPRRPRPLNREDRLHGDLAFQLIGSWHYWVKRRVENVSLVGATTARHRLSIDFCIREWFPRAAVPFGQDMYYYLPLTLLSKHPLHDLDARDESGRAIPLLTRRKRSAIAAGALSAMAKAALVSDHRSRLAAGLPGPLPTTKIQDIHVPQSLEDYFYDVANAGPQDDEPNGEVGGPALLDRFLESFDEQTLTPDPSTWHWRKNMSEDRPLWESDADDVVWRAFLVSQPTFWGLLNDLAHMFAVFVPIKADVNARRIIKLSYQAQVKIPRLNSSVRTRSLMPERATDFYAATKDTFEGILRRPGADWASGGFLAHPTGANGRVGLSAFHKAAEAVGWAPKTMYFETLSVGHGGSYHFEYQVPNGLQIRQATLTVHTPSSDSGPGHDLGTVRRRTVMGAQTLQRAHLYLGNLPPNSAGGVSIRLKVAPTTLLRGAWFAAFLSTALLFLGFVQIDTLTSRSEGNLGPSLALFLLLPGLIAGLLTRGEEHPMTTNMLFGLRCLCAFVASLPTSAAFLVLGFRSSDGFVEVWMTLLGLSASALAILSVTWWLAARRRPDGSAP